MTTKTREELNELERQGYSCGDCVKLDACRSLGMNEFGFICFSFSLDADS